MSSQTWHETIISSATDGPTLTAAARASCIPVADRIVLPTNFFAIGRVMRIFMHGRISNAVTTPGTARFDVCLGSAGTTIVYDTGALNLNIVAKTTVPWWLEIDLTCRAVGISTSTTFFGTGRFTSESVILSSAAGVGGVGTILAPVGAPAVGAGFDNTAASALDVFFTQTAATGSLIVHGYRVDVLN